MLKSEPVLTHNSEHIGTFVDQQDRFEVYLNADNEITIQCFVGMGVSAQMIPYTYDELDSALRHRVDKIVLKSK